MNIIDSTVANSDQLLIESFEEMKKKEKKKKNIHQCATQPHLGWANNY